MEQADEAFTVWVRNEPRGPGQLGFQGAMLKSGPHVAKTVTVAEYGDAATGEVRKREVRFRTSPRRSDGPGFDFSKPERTWACENDEIDRLVTFLNASVASSGRYKLVDTTSPEAAAVELVRHGSVDPAALVEALLEHGNVSQLAAALSTSHSATALAEAAVVARRRELVDRLQQMAAAPGTTETEMHHEIGDAYWLFGGRYVGVADRRNLAPLDQHDIPLLRADGTLHIVELKGPDIPRLVRRHLNHLIVGSAVHEAVSQAMNYLRTLDETGAVLTTTYRNEFGVSYDMRRVFATVVIGHPARANGADADVQQIEQTVRTYNSHLARVEVVTYAELLDSAERALAFEDSKAQDAAAQPEPDPSDEPPF